MEERVILSTQKQTTELNPVVQSAVTFRDDSEVAKIETSHLKDFFGLTKASLDDINKMRYITQAYKALGVTDPSDQIIKLKAKELELGSTTDNKLSRIYRVMRLDSQIEALLKEREALK